MTSRYRLAAVTLLFLCFSTQLNAAVRLEYLKKDTTVRGGGAPVEEEFSTVTVVDGPRLYFESRGTTTIIDRVKNEVIFVNHKKRIYRVGRLPFRLEDYVEEQYKPKLLAEAEASEAIVTMDRSEETVMIGPWNTRKIHVEATAPQSGHRAVFEIWTSTDLEVDLKTCDALAQVRFAQSYLFASIAEQTLPIGGITIRQKAEMSSWGTTKSSMAELKSFSTIEVDPKAFRPPTGYRQVPLDLSDAFKVKTLPPGAVPK